MSLYFVCVRTRKNIYLGHSTLWSKLERYYLFYGLPTLLPYVIDYRLHLPVDAAPTATAVVPSPRRLYQSWRITGMWNFWIWCLSSGEQYLMIQVTVLWFLGYHMILLYSKNLWMRPTVIIIDCYKFTDWFTVLCAQGWIDINYVC